jgi:hypothetical protein
MHTNYLPITVIKNSHIFGRKFFGKGDFEYIEKENNFGSGTTGLHGSWNLVAGLTKKNDSV